MLAISLTATLSANVFINAIAFLIPAMNTQRGTGLATAGLLAITATSYPLAFAVCGLFPLAALPFFPLVANRSASASTPSRL
jgi:hypothetical protein